MLSIILIVLLVPSILGLDGVDYGAPSKSRGLTAAEKTLLLNLHNKYRAVTAAGGTFNKPKAANMVKMAWNESEAQQAQAWADNCGGPAHNRPGQNFAGAFPASIIFRSAFIGWNDREEEKWTTWTPTQGDGKDWWPKGAGHFSQVVWAHSYTVGCGFNSCNQSMARLICNYYPAGNFVGQAPYLVGAPCSKCPSGSTCVDKVLCSNPGNSTGSGGNGTGGSGGDSGGDSGNNGGNSGGGDGGSGTCTNDLSDDECNALKEEESDLCRSEILKDWCKKACGQC